MDWFWNGQKFLLFLYMFYLQEFISPTLEENPWEQMSARILLHMSSEEQSKYSMGMLIRTLNIFGIG